MSDTFKQGRRHGHRPKGWFMREWFHGPSRREHKRLLRKILGGEDVEQVFPHPRKPKDYFD